MTRTNVGLGYLAVGVVFIISGAISFALGCCVFHSTDVMMVAAGFVFLGYRAVRLFQLGDFWPEVEEEPPPGAALLFSKFM